ncbi:flippase-like domain-containing protein [Candidatus Aminicenantes bacterium AC-335-B20]|nr:flippase-like domain-containing protein [Candidatus Aminicenantes bacterium AC-335-G13]MCP2598831.1 flippase-like domain-containing protein [Candidatus Aminicenantes bacterium AC-335-B20]
MKEYKNYFYFIASVLISGILIWYLLSQIDFKVLKNTIVNIYFPSLYAYMCLSLISSWFRAWRYKFLLKPEQITWSNIFLVTFIRNLFVDLLPARIGSLSYIYLLNKRFAFTFELATSTFLMAVVFDFLTLSPVLILAMLIIGFGEIPISIPTLLLLTLFFFLITYFILIHLERIVKLSIRIFYFIFNKTKLNKKKWAEKAIKKLELTSISIEQIKARKIFWQVFSVSLLIRVAKYGSLFFLLHAILLSHGFSLKDLSFLKLVLGVTGAEFSSILPVKGIAGFGTWESAWAISFKLMGFDVGLAIISGVSLHLITQIFEYLLGILSIIIIAFPILRKRKNYRN